MKLIEALKQIKDLERKKDDLVGKVRQHSAQLNFETPVYEDTKAQVAEWIQAHHDILAEILRLRIAIQRTNLETEVTIELDEKPVTKSIAEWIHRRRDLAKAEHFMWSALTDRGLKEGAIQESSGQIREVKIIRNYDPEQRDKKMWLYDSEPHIIDAKLEIVNAITTLIED